MTGDFVITREHLLALGACSAGVEFFDRTYQDGRAEYQDMLDKAVDGGHTDYASWLLAKIGPTEDTLEVDEINSADTDVVFAGSIRVRTRIVVGCIEAGGGIEAGRGIEAGGGIEAGDGIKAGRGIEAGWGIKADYGIKAGRGIEAGRGIKAGYGIEAGDGIKAGRGIEAGGGIEAGRGIEAGWGFGVYAGLHVRITETDHRTIKAASKPDNIMCGVWEDA